MSQVGQETFRKALNSTFTLQLDKQSYQLQLIECNDQTSEDVPGFERFSLIFASKDPLLDQATYSINHPELGDTDLFLVPVHGDDKGYQYEAIINHKTD